MAAVIIPFPTAHANDDEPTPPPPGVSAQIILFPKHRARPSMASVLEPGKVAAYNERCRSTDDLVELEHLYMELMEICILPQWSEDAMRPHRPVFMEYTDANFGVLLKIDQLKKRAGRSA